MRLIKKLEAEVLEVYKTFWESLLNVDLKKFNALLDDDFRQIGTTDGEVFFTRQAASRFLKATEEQLVGNLELRNQKLKIEALDKKVLITDLSDAYIKIDNEWTFYARVRNTFLLHQTKDGWKFLLQHSSVPDHRANEGETIGLEKISKENLELREAVKRRTVELENKTRELEIESALERVRTMAMGMKKPDDMLDICRTISTQMAQLGVKEIRNVQTAIFYETRGTYMNYEYYAKHDKTFITDVEYKNHKVQLSFATKMMKGTGEEVREHFSGKRLRDWYDYQKSTNQFADKYLLKADSVNYYWYSLGPVALGLSTYYPISKEEMELFKRFLKVFELAYRRYLDIEKAEAQAREAEIELGLERVRSKAMAMHDSSDILATTTISFEELKNLGIHSIRCGIGLLSRDSLEARVYASATDSTGAFQTMVGRRDMNEHPSLIRQYDTWLKQENSVETLSGEELRSYYSLLFFRSPQNSALHNFEEKQYGYYFPFADGLFYSWSDQPYTENEINILDRFKTIMALTFRRYLDLQKAEAQARKAQIELGLERVRARAMAMQHSDELAELVSTVFRELNHLDFSLASCIIWIHNTVEKTNTLWIASEEMNKPARPLQVVPFYPPFFNSIIPAWKAKDSKWIFSLTGKEKKKFEKLFFSEYPELPDELKKPVSENKQITFSASFNNFGALEVVATVPLTDEKFEILHRFGKVFDSSYTRFNDLKKAEAQTREAQIEASMERVRSRTMAMQKSAELGEVAVLLYNELKILGVTQQFFETGYVEIDEVNKIQTGWTTAPDGNYLDPFTLPLNGEPVLDARYEAWKQRVPVFKQVVSGEALKRTIEFTLPYMGNKEAEEITRKAPDSIIFYCGNFEHGYLSINSDTLLGTDAELLLARFTRVFEMTYKRFLDLQKAEAQAREAQIEAALERVRSRTMAMHKSEELLESSEILFSEMQKLGIESLTAGYVLLDKEGKNGLNYTPDPSTKKILPLPVIIPHDETIHMKQVVKNWKKGTSFYVVEMDEEETIKHQTFIAERSTNFTLNAAELIAISPSRLFLHNFYFKEGYLLIVGGKKLPAEQTDIMLRFAKVFQQTYTRFLDLQKSEYQTHQAKIETALEKVRARALAMQQPEELTEVAQVMRYEMGLLGVEELETSSIYIHEDQSNQAECWYAIKDIRVPEKKLVADHFVLSLQDTWVGRQMFDFYQSPEKQISIPMQGANRKEWINYCSERSKLLDGFYGEVIPERTYHLYKFSNGTIGAATPGNISAESWDLLQRAASVFSLAYSRFKDLTQARTDLQKLKEEKQRAEAALADLQTTQKQLIQAEKMASLGELTAGIAHEIQNPLNFVNNFSEINTELSDELSEAAQKGDLQDIIQLANDIRSNQEKINEHGKRADAIVKGMLQHSRSSSGVKEPTNINGLADEYLRLAYHGLKAKDRLFNATIKTDLDQSIGSVDIIPQEIGRVLLNLINNAFYAVNEKKKQVGDGYEPEVMVSTKLINAQDNPSIRQSVNPLIPSANSLIISVRDNGTGIPENIRNKIFQPFFTTKPTGQGTGLGLSLSYDIVKAHGGEISVKNTESGGAEFIVTLPMISV